MILAFLSVACGGQVAEQSGVDRHSNDQESNAGPWCPAVCDPEQLEAHGECSPVCRTEAGPIETQLAAVADEFCLAVCVIDELEPGDICEPICRDELDELDPEDPSEYCVTVCEPEVLATDGECAPVCAPDDAWTIQPID